MRFPTSDLRPSAFAAATADKPASALFSGLCAAAVGAWGVAAAVHYHRLGLTLAHYDARAHLVVARRVFDSLMPDWQQVGAVWLPLPHLLNALPVLADGRRGYRSVVRRLLRRGWTVGPQPENPGGR